MSSIRKRSWKTKEGKTKTAWEADIYHEGKRYKKSGFQTKIAAEAWIQKNSLTLSKNIIQDKSLTFNQAAEDFITIYADVYCKKSTLSSYRSYLNCHLLPFFGPKKVVDIKQNDILEYMSLKLNEYSNKTINHHITLVHSILEKLVVNDQLYSNPVSKVKKLRNIQDEMLFLNRTEVLALLKVIKTHFNDTYALIFTAIFTGMRKGELLALTWDDVDFNSKKININKSLWGNTVQTPKTIKSIRKIDMSNELVKTLIEHKKQQNIMTQIVFHNKLGGYLDPGNVTKRRFEPALKKAGVTRIRFHDLRHTYASMLIAQNIPITYIQAQMGHSSIQVTIDRYGHVMPETHTQAVNALDNFILKTDCKIDCSNLVAI